MKVTEPRTTDSKVLNADWLSVIWALIGSEFYLWTDCFNTAYNFVWMYYNIQGKYVGGWGWFCLVLTQTDRSITRSRSYSDLLSVRFLFDRKLPMNTLYSRSVNLFVYIFTSLITLVIWIFKWFCFKSTETPPRGDKDSTGPDWVLLALCLLGGYFRRVVNFFNHNSVWKKN